ncbi:hypothetical protein [Pseudovibrio sp. Ad37]|uniref:DUF7683 domain-containing protein n=1 Tax=Pseudovibrio sp. Ad37 TaxID=989422 RepID=UPI0007AEA965|nr:hypothetical protein [Pseudovibrio sp. Ad37]KZL13037.1 hypothetical protein PsAD37_05533 [Pseudovibrio sp. Ad37]
MPRLIRYFDKETEEVSGQIALANPDLAELRFIFDVPKHDPMYDCWRIDGRTEHQLRKYIDQEIVFDYSKYDYFLEYDTD